MYSASLVPCLNREFEGRSISFEILGKWKELQEKREWDFVKCFFVTMEREVDAKRSS